jgi:cytochrome c-type biogenesis protein CcmE
VKQKAFLVPAIGVALVMLGVLYFGNLNRNLIYYLTPTEAVASRADFPDGRRLRLGGLVMEGSMAATADGVRFEVGDERTTVAVLHLQAPQQLFQEGIGVVVEGSWQGERFVSTNMMVRHDEEYRAPQGEGPYRPPDRSP